MAIWWFHIWTCTFGQHLQFERFLPSLLGLATLLENICFKWFPNQRGSSPPIPSCTMKHQIENHLPTSRTNANDAPINVSQTDAFRSCRIFSCLPAVEKTQEAPSILLGAILLSERILPYYPLPGCQWSNKTSYRFWIPPKRRKNTCFMSCVWWYLASRGGNTRYPVVDDPVRFHIQPMSFSRIKSDPTNSFCCKIFQKHFKNLESWKCDILYQQYKNTSTTNSVGSQHVFCCNVGHPFLPSTRRDQVL